MKLCVAGAGAIGGYLAVRLAGTGAEVSVIARGAHLEAIRAGGLRLHEADGSIRTAVVRASTEAADLGVQDLVILGMKAHQLAPMVPALAPLIGPDTLVLTAQNGIPWWYFFKHGGEHEGRHIEAVDPGGRIARQLPVERTLGCVVYPAAELMQPGTVRVLEGNRFSLGELDGADTARVRALAQRFRDAGFKSPVVADIRSELWLKLWGNLSFNPISALTHATLEDICHFEPTRALAARMMGEAQAIGERLGVRFKVSIEQRIAGAAAVGAHKTSMLQDVEAGRVLELDALVKSVIELGQVTGVATPTIDAVHALAALLAQRLAQVRGRLAIEPI